MPGISDIPDEVVPLAEVVSKEVAEQVAEAPEGDGPKTTLHTMEARAIRVTITLISLSSSACDSAISLTNLSASSLSLIAWSRCSFRLVAVLVRAANLRASCVVYTHSDS